MPLSSRAVAALGWLLAALSLTMFAVLSIRGRAGHGSVPVWESARFARLEGAPVRAARTWMVAVNFDCPHCRASLPELAALARRENPHPEFAVLLVDSPGRPSADSVAALPATSVWWDSAYVWRRSWHRSAYGEVLVFDAAGRLVSVRSPAGAP